MYQNLSLIHWHVALNDKEALPSRNASYTVCTICSVSGFRTFHLASRNRFCCGVKRARMNEDAHSVDKDEEHLKLIVCVFRDSWFRECRVIDCLLEDLVSFQKVEGNERMQRIHSAIHYEY